MASAAPRPVGDKLVTVFGGSGFIGRHVVRALARAGWRVRVAVRRPDLAGHLQPLGVVGQVVATQANLRYPESVAQAAKGADAVVNLVGILAESGKQSFETLQAEGPRVAARAAREAGASLFVQMSAIGADRASKAVYGKTKAAGEEAALGVFPDAVILRPSIVFGPEDDFFNRFAALARFAPALPLIGGGKTRFQPVFVGDVAQAVAGALDGKVRGGAGAYELGGPDILTFEEILRYVLKETGRDRALAPLPFGLAKAQAKLLQLLPNAPLTVDQVTMLETDNVVSNEARADGRTLAAFGIEPTPIEAVVPSYLWRYRKAGQFEKTRAEA
ncbi:complex I NDUFA9 subunit family protein [Chelatococcus sambhunathii]|uniref:Complex I NDUFA9 subunit family protein n=1 Tax=Chelatococcus sambhunathii TaxID=363953 RepID=A0ABU1DGW5_9HYPH|nr:complex I NDUFA9 subunit family protein [Chelatococcus sambhunathii]MDR4307145.1 complex I NDUFA9 subunit family protein [Chelatococcus sambhunathii]